MGPLPRDTQAQIKYKWSIASSLYLLRIGERIMNVTPLPSEQIFPKLPAGSATIQIAEKNKRNK